MNYKLVSDSEKNIYSVFEVRTEQIVAVSNSIKNAKDLLRKYNGGGSFNGFTPSFVLRKVSNRINKNA